MSLPSVQIEKRMSSAKPLRVYHIIQSGNILPFVPYQSPIPARLHPNALQRPKLTREPRSCSFWLMHLTHWPQKCLFCEMCRITPRDRLMSKLICLQGHALLCLRYERTKASFAFRSRDMQIEVLYHSHRLKRFPVFLRLSWFYLMFTRSVSFYFGIMIISHLMLGTPGEEIHV